MLATTKVYGWVLLMAVGIGLLSQLVGCGSDPRNASHANVPLANIRKGKVLAAKYCGSCHALPDPSLLDAATWERGVLPQMGPRLGIFAYGEQQYPSAKGNPYLPAGFYPSQPVLSYVDWQNIIDYYTATAPDSLVLPKQQIATGLQQFLVLQPAYFSPNPLATFTAIDSAKKQVSVYDMGSQQLLHFDSQLKLLDSLSVPGAISDMHSVDDAFVWTNMGDIYPSDAALGSVQLKQPGKLQPDTLFKDLQRPVVLQHADINKDGRTDFVVGSFGFLTGHLSWYEGKADGRYQQHIIKPLPGAAQVIVTDENKDGLPDLWVLFAQGDESIRKFTNRGGGKFEEKVVLRFPPVWGSTSFELVDMDGDGDKDIVYTCGDNADYSQVLKPYHGVYVYLQAEPGVFKQQQFYHLNGAFKARTLDFDKDGDQDIAAISFFADYQHQPSEGFVYLENKGKLQFAASTFMEAAAGRWITLDAGDLNGDGWPDLVLGNMAKPGSMVPTSIDWKKAPLFVVLRNRKGF